MGKLFTGPKLGRRYKHAQVFVERHDNNNLPPVWMRIQADGGEPVALYLSDQEASWVIHTLEEAIKEYRAAEAMREAVRKARRGAR